MSDLFYNSPTLTEWRGAAGHDWPAYVTHDFVKGLADGTLPAEAFQRYLIQDYIFLVHFTRAWAMAVVKSESLEEMKIAAATVDALVNQEMQLHVQTCLKAGISEDQLYGAEEAVENLTYTRFVMDAGISGDFLDLMAALSPCVFGYGEIGLFTQKTKQAGTSYHEWIEAYSGNDYQNLCLNVAAMVEKATLSRLGPRPFENPRWPSLCKRFQTATKLETNFWEMGLKGSKW